MKNLVFNKFGNIATTVKNLDKTITEKVNNKKKAPKPPDSQTAPTPITKEDLKNIPLDDEELKATKIQTVIRQKLAEKKLKEKRNAKRNSIDNSDAKTEAGEYNQTAEDKTVQINNNFNKVL